MKAKIFILFRYGGEAMKIVYMGTPDFAVYPLEKLIKENYDVGYVVCQKDTAKDRGKKIKFPPVKEKALEYNIKVLQPETIKKNEEFFNTLKNYNPDLIVVAAYGKILPREILTLPKHGCVNIHASILPRWRGAAPIQHAIMAGDETTGVSLMVMEEGLDTGAVIDEVATKIARKNSQQLHEELSKLGGDLLISNLDNIINGNVNLKKQDDSLATYANMLVKADGLLDFFQEAEILDNKVRALYPWPGTYTYLNGEIFKVWEAEVIESVKQRGNTPGRILEISEKGIDVATGKGVLRIKKVQVPNKKKMEASEFIRGNKIEIGSILG